MKSILSMYSNITLYTNSAQEIVAIEHIAHSCTLYRKIQQVVHIIHSWKVRGEVFSNHCTWNIMQIVHIVHSCRVTREVLSVLP